MTQLTNITTEQADKVFKLIGISKDGVEDWDVEALYKTRELAEHQKQIEICAYTMVNGIERFDCPFEFEIIEVEAKRASKIGEGL